MVYRRAHVHRRLFCVSTVSSVCATKPRVPLQAEDVCRSAPIVADTADGADGADGAIGSVFLYGCYPDRPRSEPPLAVKDNLR